MNSMDSTDKEVAFQYYNYIKIYKDGQVERLIGTDTVPPSLDPKTGVTSKDINITPQISARLYLPKLTSPNQKLPVIVHFHGGGFCVSSPATAKQHNYLNAIVSKANVVAVSVGYRRAPEHFIPTAYEDSWTALNWVVSHSDNNGDEAWLNDHADFDKLFLAGCSVGANIAHNLGIVAGDPDFGMDVSILGIALVHPFFWGKDSIGSEELKPGKERYDRLWPFVCPSNPDNDDPRVNPVADGAPSLGGLGCRRVLVCVAENDILKDRGRLYYDALGKSGWFGVAEIFETQEEDHAFYMRNMESENAKELIQKLTEFFNREMPPLI